MKKYILSIGLLFVLLTTTSYALAKNSEFAICKYTLAELATGKHKNEVVNEAGMTGNQVYEMLESYTQQQAGVTLREFVEKATESKITEKHFNTQALKSGIEVYFDDGPSGHKKSLKDAHIKVECCNIVGTDRGLINNFLKDFFSKNRDRGSVNDKPSNGQLDQKETNNKKDKMEVEVTFKGAQTVAQQTNDGNSLAWIIFGILGLIALVGLIMYMADRRRERQAQAAADLTAARQAVIADQQAYLNTHYAQVGQFMTAAQQMNLNTAQNAQQVHNAWETINPPRT